LPPRMLKSHAASVAFVAWILGHRPSSEIITASYGQDLADKHARDCRTLINSRFFQSLFPGTVLSQDKRAVNDFMTTEQGSRMSTSVGGVLTGRGADYLILDDILKPEDALSDTRRNGANDWFNNTLLSRLNSKENGVIIIVMQRLHQDDLVGHVLEQGGEWEILSLPAIAEEDETYVIEDYLGRRIFTRKAGDALHPERDSLETLERIRQSIPEYDFQSQYQQNPIPQGGSLIRREWLQFYELSELPKRFSFVLQSWDTANKSGELNDYSVCTTWGVLRQRFYLLNVFRCRLNYPELKQAVIEQFRRYQPRRVLIEDKASGTQLIQELRGSILGVVPYEPPPGNDKTLRVYAQTIRFAQGSVFLPVQAPWLDEYLRELLTFPGSKYDDQVDSTTQALDFLGSSGRALITWAKLGAMETGHS
jgi:predicted phage terminase large subunit-like protein